MRRRCRSRRRGGSSRRRRRANRRSRSRDRPRPAARSPQRSPARARAPRRATAGRPSCRGRRRRRRSTSRARRSRAASSSAAEPASNGVGDDEGARPGVASRRRSALSAGERSWRRSCSLREPGGASRCTALASVVERSASTRRTDAASYPRRMSFDLVLFGGTGDLTWRKLMPALFQAWRHGKLPEGGRILAVARHELERRRLPRLAEGALPRRRGREAPERRRVRPLRRAAPLPAPRPLAAGRLRAPEGVARVAGRPRAPADVVVMYLATSPHLFPVDLRAARRGRAERPERARRAREAARPRPRERAGDQPRRPLGVQRGAGLPHRPLPRQARGAEPDGAALRQRPVRAALAARVHRQHPDHARRSRSASARAATSTTAPARCAT